MPINYTRLVDEKLPTMQK